MSNTTSPIQAWEDWLTSLALHGSLPWYQYRRQPDVKVPCLVITTPGIALHDGLQQVYDPWRTQLKIYSTIDAGETLGTAYVNALRPYVGDTSAAQIISMNGWEARHLQVAGPQYAGIDPVSGNDTFIVDVLCQYIKRF